MPTENRLRFNKKSLETLPAPESGRQYYYDMQTPGLAVCVTSRGAKTFYVYKRIGSQPIRYRLGKFHELSVEQARKMTIDALRDIARGVNPQRERKSSRKGLTMKIVFDHWLDYAKAHKKTWKEDEREIEMYFRKWDNRRLEDLQPKDIIKLQHKIKDDSGPYMANRVLEKLRAAIGKAITELKWKGENPCVGIKAFKEETRDRFLQPEELPKFFGALEDEEPLIRDFFLLCLFTGARRGNVATMQWSELQQTVWRIPETKNGSPVLVPLVPEAIAVLAQRREEVDDNCPWVFPSSRSKTGHLVEPKSAWKRVCKRAELEDLRIHDLRRTLGSWLAMGGASLPIIGKALGHGMNSKATAVYARLMLDPVREQLENATSAILANVSGNKEASENEVSEEN